MRVLRETPFMRLGYRRQGGCLELRPSPAGNRYRHDGLDVYWKVGITLPDIDVAFEQLRNADVAVTEPRHFQDIGYMCHLADPEGFQVELLQHTFAGQPRTARAIPASPSAAAARSGRLQCGPATSTGRSISTEQDEE